MRGQRAKLTLAERRKRAARNERRGRQPQVSRVAHADRASHYRYRGLTVRLLGDRLTVVRVWNPHLKAYLPAEAPRSLPRLPLRHRKRIRREAEDIRRRERVEGMGVELPKGDVWTPAEEAG